MTWKLCNGDGEKVYAQWVRCKGPIADRHYPTTHILQCSCLVVGYFAPLSLDNVNVVAKYTNLNSLVRLSNVLNSLLDAHIYQSSNVHPRYPPCSHLTLYPGRTCISISVSVVGHTYNNMIIYIISLPSFILLVS